MHPNAEDGLVPDITELFKRDYAAYKRKAIDHTAMHASLAVEAPTQGIEAPGATNSENIASRGIDTPPQQSVVNEPSSDNTQHASDSGAKDELEYEYEYVADGYTLIGCNLGSRGQVLQLTVNDCDKDSELNNCSSLEPLVVAEEVESKPQKRQRKQL